MKVADLQECFLAAAEDADSAVLVATTANHVSDAPSSQTRALAHLYVMKDTREKEHIYCLQH